VGARERTRGDPRRALVARGEVAWLELEQEGRRPVVVLTRDEALPRLRNVVVALVTRTIRGIDTEVELGPADGMPIACAVSLDNLRTVPQALLTESITRLDAERMDALCRALTRAAGC
jgi:mRNA interferase MazF